PGLPTPRARASATAASGGIRGWPAGLAVNPPASTLSARTAIRSLTRTPSASVGSEISADVRAVSDTTAEPSPSVRQADPCLVRGAIRTLALPGRARIATPVDSSPLRGDSKRRPRSPDEYVGNRDAPAAEIVGAIQGAGHRAGGLVKAPSRCGGAVGVALGVYGGLDQRWLELGWGEDRPLVEKRSLVGPRCGRQA